MSQGPLCPNLTKKFHKEVSQIANRNLPCMMLLGGLSVNLNHLKTPTHRWKSLHRFQIFKQNRNISIRSSLIAFLVIWGGTPWGMGGCGVGWGHPHAHAHICTHTCMHVKHDKHGCLHHGGHLQFPNMFILAFHVYACMCTCLGTPPMPPDAPHPICPLPRAISL